MCSSCFYGYYLNISDPDSQSFGKCIKKPLEVKPLNEIFVGPVFIETDYDATIHLGTLSNPHIDLYDAIKDANERCANTS